MSVASNPEILTQFATALTSPEYRAALKAGDPKRLASKLTKLLIVGNFLFDCIGQIEANFRGRVLDGLDAYDPDEERKVEGYFAQWLSPCRDIKRQIRSVEAKGLKVRGAGKFRKNCKFADRIASGDSPFFDSEDKVVWKWFSITSRHRTSPRSVVYREDGRIYEEDGRRFVAPGMTRADVMRMLASDRTPYRSLAEAQAEARARRGEA